MVKFCLWRTIRNNKVLIVLKNIKDYVHWEGPKYGDTHGYSKEQISNERKRLIDSLGELYEGIEDYLKELARPGRIRDQYKEIFKGPKGPLEKEYDKRKKLKDTEDCFWIE